MRSAAAGHFWSAARSLFFVLGVRGCYQQRHESMLLTGTMVHR